MHRTSFLLACFVALPACTSTSSTPQTSSTGDSGIDATPSASPDASGADAGEDAAQPNPPSASCPVAYCEQYCANLGQVFYDCIFEDTPLCTCEPADASTDASDGGDDGGNDG